MTGLALKSVTFQYDPDATVHGSDAEYAAELLGRILDTVKDVEGSPALAKIVQRNAKVAEILATPHRTTFQEDAARRDLLNTVAVEVLDLVVQRLNRRVGADLATSLLPRLENGKS